MKLATIVSKNLKNRDGQLVVVSRDLKRAAFPNKELSQTLKSALENWEEERAALNELYEKLNANQVTDAFNLDLKSCLAPLPNAAGFYDGSAFLSHVHRARQARGDKMPESAKITPLMYQGVSDNQMGPYAPLAIQNEAFGADFEGEFAVITADVPRAASPAQCEKQIALIVMFNDISLREIIKTEIETKFGFLQSKPNNAFAPIAITPDELGEHWSKGRVAADLQITLNGQKFGTPNGREMHFSFFELVAHAARTRPLAASSIIGSGTVSNEDKAKGFACLTEKRFLEIIETGKVATPWLKPGDRIQMEVTLNGQSLFGPIDQTATL